jgi:hypothetical protein
MPRTDKTGPHDLLWVEVALCAGQSYALRVNRQWVGLALSGQNQSALVITRQTGAEALRHGGKTVRLPSSALLRLCGKKSLFLDCFFGGLSGQKPLSLTVSTLRFLRGLSGSLRSFLQHCQGSGADLDRVCTYLRCGGWLGLR